MLLDISLIFQINGVDVVREIVSCRNCFIAYKCIYFDANFKCPMLSSRMFKILYWIIETKSFWNKAIHHTFFKRQDVTLNLGWFVQ